jgi:hypothetical protein
MDGVRTADHSQVIHSDPLNVEKSAVQQLQKNWALGSPCKKSVTFYMCIHLVFYMLRARLV